MQEPELWPFSSERDWRLWLCHLATVQDCNVETLRREAERELARIARHAEGRWEPKRPALVPLDRATNGLRE